MTGAHLEQHDDLCNFGVFETIKEYLHFSNASSMNFNGTGSLHKFSTKIHKLIVISLKRFTKSI